MDNQFTEKTKMTAFMVLSIKNAPFFKETDQHAYTTANVKLTSHSNSLKREAYLIFK